MRSIARRTRGREQHERQAWRPKSRRDDIRRRNESLGVRNHDADPVGNRRMPPADDDDDRKRKRRVDVAHFRPNDRQSRGEVFPRVDFHVGRENGNSEACRIFYRALLWRVSHLLLSSAVAKLYSGLTIGRYWRKRWRFIAWNYGLSWFFLRVFFCFFNAGCFVCVIYLEIYLRVMLFAWRRPLEGVDDSDWCRQYICSPVFRYCPVDFIYLSPPVWGYSAIFEVLVLVKLMDDWRMIKSIVYDRMFRAVVRDWADVQLIVENFHSKKWGRGHVTVIYQQKVT